MALTSVTKVAGASASQGGNVPLKYDEMLVVGPSSYSAGGEDFLALFTAEVGDGREPVMVVAQDSNGYSVEYIRSTDKLVIRWYDYDAGGDGVAIEPTGEDLSGITFKLGVLSR